MSDEIKIGSRVRLKASEAHNYTQPYRRLAETGRVATVLNAVKVFGILQILCRFDVKRRGAIPVDEVFHPEHLELAEDNAV